MENNIVEQKDNKNLIICVLVVLLLTACCFIYYDKFLKKSDSPQNTTSNETLVPGDTVKIMIKRNGVTKLESVPNDIVGKYENDAGDYYILNQDGTAEIYANTGCSDCGSDSGLIPSSELTYQLEYVGSGNEEIVNVTFFLNSNDNMYVPGTSLRGFKHGNAYRFYVTEHTPTSVAGETVFDKK